MTANVIIKQVLLRRGNTANTSVYVGPIGEAVVDTDLKTLRIQDGSTPGGTLLATANSISSAFTGISSINANVAAANVAIAALQSNAAYQAQAINSLEITAGNIGSSIVTANTAMKGYVDTQISSTNAKITAANLEIANLWANAASQDYHIGVLYGNAAAQHYNLLNLNSNALVQTEQINYLFSNAASQANRLDALESMDVYQDGFLGNLLANSAAQGYEIQNLWANAATQANSLSIITSDTTAIWANSAVQENEISGLRANIIAANAAMIAANTNLKNYTDYQIGSRTGEITFSGRTISANVVGGNSGIDFAPEIRFASFVGFNNPDPEHWVDIGDGTLEAGQNTGSLGIGFNNGEDTLRGHAIIGWDWWDSTLGIGSHNDGTGTHARLVIINNDNFDKPYISFDYNTANVVIGNVTANILHSTVGHFSGNTYSSYVIFNNDVRYSNGTPYMSGISARLDAANVVNSAANISLSNRIDAANVVILSSANSYTDTKVANLINGAPAILDTLSEIAESLGNNASLSSTLLNLIATTNSNVTAANANIGELWANALAQNTTLNNLYSNSVAQGEQINSLTANAATQETEISELRSNISAANAAIITNLSYTNQLNSSMVANVTATNAAIITANTAMKGYVDDHIDLALGNLEIQDTTITTKTGATQTIILDAGSEIVLRDFTGIRNPNPGYWLHIGDALDNSGTAHNGQLAIDYSDGSGGSEATGRRGSVVFDYLWWSNIGQGNYNGIGAPLRRFGLFKDGDYPQYANEAFKPYFTVDLDTKIFRVNSLQSGTSILAANIYSTGNIHAVGNYTGNVRTDGYFFANGAPLVIPPLVVTGNTAPTTEEGATEGALWWNNEDGRAYIKYSENWVELSPTVLPPISRYVGNVTFYNHNISNVGNITPHTTLTYDIGKDDYRWKDFYVDTINTTGNIDIGANLNVSGDAVIGGNVMFVTDIAVDGSASVSSDLGITGNVNVTTDVNVTGNVNVATDVNVVGNANITSHNNITGNVNAESDINVVGNVNVTTDVNVIGNLNVISEVNIVGNVNVDKGVIVGANVDILGNATVTADVNVKGNINAIGNLHVSIDTVIDGNLQVNGDISHFSNIVPLTANTYNIGTTDLRWNEFYVTTIDTTGNVSIGGNLFVYGNVTEVSTTSLIIDDSIIYMANNNPGNSIDIGIAGNFDDGTYQHTGFVRDASDNTWKLFSNVVAEPTNTVDFTFAVYDDIQVGNISSPTITDLYANIITANSAVVSFVNDQYNDLKAKVNAANAAIVTANSAVVSYVDIQDSALRANITAANAAIVTANSAVVSYVNTLNSAMSANVAAANAAIITANTGMKSYVDSRTTMANATFTGTTTFSTPGNVTIDGNATIGYNAIVVGNLQVQGTTTTINATSLTLTDKFITLANGSPNSAASSGSGLYVYGSGANILYQYVNDSWTFNRQPYFNSNVIYHAGNSNSLLKVNNPDDHTGDIDFGDANPVVNGYQIQGTWLFGGDGNVHAGAHQARLFNANGHVNSTGGYYVGSMDPYASGGTLTTTKVIDGTGTFYPSGGSGTAGIIFPNDIGGGSGDGASIKSYVSSGERTVLEIKTTNDADDDIILNSSGTVQVINNFQIGGSGIFKGISEAFTGISSATGVVAHNCSAGTIFYHTSVSANFTVNATNLKCDAGYTTSITIVISQGGTAYIPNALQIAGVAQTINWQGGSAPSGNANKKDIVSFSILNSSGTYIVFGQLVSFG